MNAKTDESHGAVASQVERPVRPRCFDAAMDGVSQYEEREIRSYIKRLEAWAESTKDAERERCAKAVRDHLRDDGIQDNAPLINALSVILRA